MKTNLIKLAVVVSLAFSLSACVVAPPRTVTYRMAPAVTYVAAQPVVTQTQVTTASPAPSVPTTTTTTTYQQPAVVQTIVQPSPVYAGAPLYVHAVAPVIYARPRFYGSIYVGPRPYWY